MTPAIGVGAIRKSDLLSGRSETAHGTLCLYRADRRRRRVGGEGGEVPLLVLPSTDLCRLQAGA